MKMKENYDTPASEIIHLISQDVPKDSYPFILDDYDEEENL